MIKGSSKKSEDRIMGTIIHGMKKMSILLGITKGRAERPARRTTSINT